MDGNGIILEKLCGARGKEVGGVCCELKACFEESIGALKWRDGSVCGVTLACVVVEDGLDSMCMSIREVPSMIPEVKQVPDGTGMSCTRTVSVSSFPV